MMNEANIEMSVKDFQEQVKKLCDNPLTCRGSSKTKLLYNTSLLIPNSLSDMTIEGCASDNWIKFRIVDFMKKHIIIENGYKATIYLDQSPVNQPIILDLLNVDCVPEAPEMDRIQDFIFTKNVCETFSFLENIEKIKTVFKSDINLGARLLISELSNFVSDEDYVSKILSYYGENLTNISLVNYLENRFNINDKI